MKQTITSEDIEWYQQNTDSRPDQQDDDYTQYEGYYTIECAQDVTISIARPFVTTMDEMVEELTTCDGFNLRLEVLSDPNDLDQFWSFNYWEVDPIAEIYGVKGSWHHPYSIRSMVDYKCCMSKELFQQVAHCFAQEIELYDMVAFEAMLKSLRLVQTTHNRNNRIDNLLALPC
ncbi:hypothetical protein [Hymenobacter siberiensis]|uniref:hypothetical protein n=1 Tax=Hymenobacter siberiensis TaxID=2848396 RepID=UPI001C1E82F6|nr:hypothetical protein [Hymenobacter siberiensis]MBU6122604.1 hypothetical protein [Hymenobacter siberiensis]